MPRLFPVLAVCLLVPVLLSSVGLSPGLRGGVARTAPASPALSIPAEAAERPTSAPPVPLMPCPPLRVLPTTR